MAKKKKKLSPAELDRNYQGGYTQSSGYKTEEINAIRLAYDLAKTDNEWKNNGKINTGDRIGSSTVPYAMALSSMQTPSVFGSDKKATSIDKSYDRIINNAHYLADSGEMKQKDADKIIKAAKDNKYALRSGISAVKKEADALRGRNALLSNDYINEYERYKKYGNKTANELKVMSIAARKKKNGEPGTITIRGTEYNLPEVDDNITDEEIEWLESYADEKKQQEDYDRRMKKYGDMSYGEVMDIVNHADQPWTGGRSENNPIRHNGPSSVVSTLQQSSADNKYNISKEDIEWLRSYAESIKQPEDYDEEIKAAENRIRNREKSIYPYRRSSGYKEAPLNRNDDSPIKFTTEYEGLRTSEEHLPEKDEEDRVTDNHFNNMTYQGGEYGQLSADIDEYNRLVKEKRNLAEYRKKEAYYDSLKNASDYDRYSNDNLPESEYASDYDRFNASKFDEIDSRYTKKGSKEHINRIEANESVMTDEEKRNFNYLYHKQGRAAAEEYLSFIQENLNRRRAEITAENIKGYPTAALFAFGSGIERGLPNAVYKARNLFAGDDAVPITENEYVNSILNERYKDAGPKILGRSLGQMGLETTENIGNMLPSMAISSAIGGPAGQVIGGIMMGASAGANAANEAWRENGDRSASIVYGLVNGILEGGLQYGLGGISAFGGKLSGVTKNVLKSKIGSTLGRVFINLGISGLSEGSEEYLQEIIDPAVRNLIMGENNEVNFITEDALYSGLQGAVTSWLLGGAGDVVNAFSETDLVNLGKISRFGEDNIVRAAEHYGLNDSIEEYESSGQTDLDLGKLANDVYREQNREAVANIGKKYADRIDVVIEAAKYLNMNSNINEYNKSGKTDHDTGMLVTEVMAKIGNGIQNAKTFKEAQDIFEKMIDGAPEYVKEVAGEALSQRARAEIETKAENDIKEAKARADKANGVDKMSENTKNVKKAMSEGTLAESEDFDNGFNYFYGYGRAGVDVDTAIESDPYGVLTDNEKKLAWQQGVNDRNAFYNEAVPGRKAEGKFRFLKNEQITDEMREKGIREADAKKDPVDRGTLDVLTDLSSIHGINTVAYASDPVEESGVKEAPNGWYDPNTNTIYVDLTSENAGKNASLLVYSHEFTHSLKENAPTEYKALADYIIKAFSGDKEVNITDLANEQIRLAKDNGIDLTYEQAVDEVIAEASQELFKNSKAIEDLYEKEPKVFNRIKEFIKEIITKIQSTLKKMDPASDSAKLLKAYLGDMKEAQKLYDNAVKASIKREGEKNTDNRGSENVKDIVYDLENNKTEQYMFRTDEYYEKIKPCTREEAKYLKMLDERNIARYRKEINGIFDGSISPRKRIFIGMPPKILIDNNVPNKLIWISQDTARKIAYPKDYLKSIKGLKYFSEPNIDNDDIYGKHNLGISMLKNIPYMLYNPMAITKNTDEHEDKGDDSKAIWANWKTEKGKSVGLILKVNKNGEVVVGNEVATAMDLDTSSNYFTQFFEESKILYPKNKSIDQLLTGRRQLPTAVADDPFARNIIHQDSDKVNTTNNAQKNENRKSIQSSFRDVAPKTDSQGRKLSSGQSEYFKDSVVRDENGDLLVMYHGTPSGGFTVFKNDLNYFTPSKKYAERYTKGRFNKDVKEQLYEVYLNITKPFDISNKTDRNIFINEYVKGGYAQGIDPYSSKADIEKYISDGIDWNEADNLKEFFDDNGYDYDGIILNEGADGGYGDEVTQRGISYVTFSPEQVKNVDNTDPTKNKDIRFSLRNDVPMIDNKGRKLSKKQSDYFKDSLIRDVDGRLITVYHGTNNDFSIFLHDHIGKNGSAEGYGFYFTDSQNFAKGYKKSDGNIIEAYLNIKKPLSLNKLTLTGREIEKLIRAIDPDGDLLISNYENTGIGYPSKEWYEKGLKETVSTLMKNNNDSDLVSELINMTDYETLSEISSILGYDGFIENDKYDNANVYVVFNSNQVKDVNNTSPSENEDIRFSLRDNRSNRKILADVLETAAANEEEKLILAEYKKQIDELDILESLKKAKLEAVWGSISSEDRSRYFDDIKKINKKLNAGDRKLLQLEATKPIKDLLAREGRQRRKEGADEIIKRYAKRDKKRSLIEQRNRGRKETEALIRMLDKPTKKDYVPEILKKPVGDFITSIDLVSRYVDPDKRPTGKWEDKLEGLARTLENYQYDGTKVDRQNGETGMGNDPWMFSPDLLDQIDSFIDGNKGKKISDLELPALVDLYKIIRKIRIGIRNSNRLFANQRFESMERAGYETIDMLDERKTRSRKRDIKIIKSLDKLFTLDMLEAKSYFKRFGEVGESIYEEFADGDDKSKVVLQKASDYVQELYKKLGINAKTVRKWGDKKAKKSFDVRGNIISMTPVQVMSLYELSKREQAMRHISRGGIKIKGEDVISVDKKTSPEKRINKGEKAVTLFNDEIKKITDTLTDEQKAFADGLQKWMADEGAKYGNEVSMEMYGSKNFTEPNYFPIKTDGNSRNAKTNESADMANLYRILNLGVTKTVDKKARNAVIITDIMSAFSEHVADMSLYYGYAMPIADAMKWFNYRYDIGHETKSVRSEMDRVFGPETQKYFKTFLEGLNGSTVINNDNLFDKAIGSYKAAAVGGNLRVVIQQPLAYIRALNIMDPKYLAKGIASRNNIKELEEYAPIAWWKNSSFRENGMGKSLKSTLTDDMTLRERGTDFLTKPAGLADKVTWGKLWNAVKYEVKDSLGDKYKNMDPDLYLKMCAKRFRQVIDETQVVDTKISRSQLMRNQNGLTKIATAFMMEPTKTYNMLYDAYTSKDGKKIARAMGVWTLENIFMVAAKSFYDAFRRLIWSDDEKEKNYWQRFLDASIDNSIDDFVPLNMIPILKEIPGIVETIFTENDNTKPQRFDIQWLYDFADAVKKSKKYISGEHNEEEMWKMLKSITKSLSNTSGVPLSNLWREVETGYNAVLYQFMGKETLHEKIREAAQYRYDGEFDKYKEAKKKILEDEKISNNELIKKLDSEWLKIKKEASGESEDNADEFEQDKAMYKIRDAKKAIEDGNYQYVQEMIDEIYNAGLPEDKSKQADYLDSKKKSIRGGLGKLLYDDVDGDGKISKEEKKELGSKYEERKKEYLKLKLNGEPLFDDDYFLKKERAVNKNDLDEALESGKQNDIQEAINTIYNAEKPKNRKEEVEYAKNKKSSIKTTLTKYYRDQDKMTRAKLKKIYLKLTISGSKIKLYDAKSFERIEKAIAEESKKSKKAG